MADWKRCAGKCRRVLRPDVFPDGSDKCNLCLIDDDFTATRRERYEAAGGSAKPRRGPQTGTVRRPDVRARTSALRRLAALHPEEYERLFAEEIKRAHEDH